MDIVALLVRVQTLSATLGDVDLADWAWMIGSWRVAIHRAFWDGCLGHFALGSIIVLIRLICRRLVALAILEKVSLEGLDHLL